MTVSTQYWVIRCDRVFRSVYLPYSSARKSASSTVQSHSCVLVCSDGNHFVLFLIWPRASHLTTQTNTGEQFPQPRGLMLTLMFVFHVDLITSILELGSILIPVDLNVTIHFSIILELNDD